MLRASFIMPLCSIINHILSTAKFFDERFCCMRLGVCVGGGTRRPKIVEDHEKMKNKLFNAEMMRKSRENEQSA